MLPRIIRPVVSSISACPSVRGFDDEIEVRPIVGAKRPTTAGHPTRADENVPCTARPSPVACRRRPLEGWASPATGWLIVLRQAFNADKARGTASVVAPSLPRRLCGRHSSQGTCRQPPQSLAWRPSCTPEYCARSRISTSKITWAAKFLSRFAGRHSAAVVGRDSS
jgi:hypothetical protein